MSEPLVRLQSVAMAYGRGPDAQRTLSIAFAERRVDKRYVAVVAGLMAADAGEVDAPLRGRCAILELMRSRERMSS